MGRGQIRISWEALAEVCQMPKDWKPRNAFMMIHQSTAEPTATVFLDFESESIEERANPTEMEGTAHVKYMDDKDDRWVKWEWKISPYQLI